MAFTDTDVVVVGAGAIGACIAHELASAGREVTVIEAGGGWGVGCSRANAGYISPGHAGPFAALGDLARAVRWLRTDTSPFGLVPSRGLTPWLLRLMRATASRSRAEATSALLLDLATESLELHREYSAGGLATGFVQAGLLDVYLSSRGLAAGRSAAAITAARGTGSFAMGSNDASDQEPVLNRGVAGAVLHPNEAYCDPFAFVGAVGTAAVRAGARLLADSPVSAVKERPDGVDVTVGTSVIRCDQVVLATGAALPALAPGLPVAAGDGFSVVVTNTASPRRPVMIQEDRLAITPVAGGMRLGGSMVLRASDAASPHADGSRLHGIVTAANRSLTISGRAEYRDRWTGARPCTPDGLPVVGRRRLGGRVIVAGGHAMLGLTLAPVTAKLVVSEIDGRPDRRLAPLRERRFG